MCKNRKTAHGLEQVCVHTCACGGGYGVQTTAEFRLTLCVMGVQGAGTAVGKPVPHPSGPEKPPG